MMFGPAVVAVIALISQIMPYVSAGTAAAGMVGHIITALEAVLPALFHTASDLIPTVKNYIATLRGASTVTKDDLDRLDAIEAVIDAAFDDAVKNAATEDAAAEDAGAPATTTDPTPGTG